MWLWVKNRYPKWNPGKVATWTKTCGTGGLILTPVHLGIFLPIARTRTGRGKALRPGAARRRQRDVEPLPSCHQGPAARQDSRPPRGRGGGGCGGGHGGGGWFLVPKPGLCFMSRSLVEWSFNCWPRRQLQTAGCRLIVATHSESWQNHDNGVILENKAH